MDAVAKMQLQLDAIQVAVSRKHCDCPCSCAGPETHQESTANPVTLNDSSLDDRQNPDTMQLQPTNQAATNAGNSINAPSSSKPASVSGQSRPTSARSASITSSHATSNRIVLPVAMPPPPSISPTATDIASAMIDGVVNVIAQSLPQIQSISQPEAPSHEQPEQPEPAQITLQPGPRNKSMNRSSSLQVGPIPHGHPLYAYSLAAETGDQPFLSKSLGRPVPRVMAAVPREPSNSSVESLESFEEGTVDLPRTATPMVPQQQQQQHQQQQRNRLPRSSSDTKVIHANDHRNSRTFRANALAGQEENWQTWESVLVESHGTAASQQDVGQTDFFPSPKRSSSVGRIGGPSGRGGWLPPPTPTGDGGFKPRFAAPLPPSNAYAPGRAR
ncbi:hypothetical protein HDU81_008848 [Chytriomyces hyalinus]|nr:hypothetical protein HDU81_008848 [Chytriomyces hyalinus]